MKIWIILSVLVLVSVTVADMHEDDSVTDFSTELLGDNEEIYDVDYEGVNKIIPHSSPLDMIEDPKEMANDPLERWSVRALGLNARGPRVAEISSSNDLSFLVEENPNHKEAELIMHGLGDSEPMNAILKGKHRYVVSVKTAYKKSRNKIVKTLQPCGNRVLYQFDFPSLNAFSVVATRSGLIECLIRSQAVFSQDRKAVSVQLAIRSIEEDVSVSVSNSYPADQFDPNTGVTPWNLDRILSRANDLGRASFDGASGEGVNVYIVDSGIVVGHPEFEGREKIAADFVGDGKNGVDCNGHGTHVAGTIGSKTFGAAKKVNIWAIRAVNCDGSGPTSSLVAAFDWILKNHKKPAIMNASLSSPEVVEAQVTAVNALTEAGIIVVVAAGNDNANSCERSPACAGGSGKLTITVGATNYQDSRSWYSNYGQCVDILSPGSMVKSTWLNNETNTISGTSMASPLTAGAIAGFLSLNPKATPKQVKDALICSATNGVIKNVSNPADRPASGNDNYSASPNKLLFVPLSTVCPGTARANPECGGLGFKKRDGKCSCQVGAEVDSTGSTCVKNVCNGQGSFDQKSGKCQCYNGYEGAKCELIPCRQYVEERTGDSKCITICSGNGRYPAGSQNLPKEGRKCLCKNTHKGDQCAEVACNSNGYYSFTGTNQNSVYTAPARLDWVNLAVSPRSTYFGPPSVSCSCNTGSESYNGQCLSPCSANQIRVNGICGSCSAKWPDCTYCTPFGCIGCQYPKTVWNKGNLERCLDPCQSDEDRSLFDPTCVSCKNLVDSNCAQCSQEKCLQCVDGRAVVDGSCGGTKPKPCAEGQVKIGNACQTCSSLGYVNCSSCNSSECTGCQLGYEIVNKVCVANCKDTEVRVDGKCVSKCTDGLSRNADGSCGVCATVFPGCITCVANQCSTCGPSYDLIGGKCLQKCAVNTIRDSVGICRSCDNVIPACSQCSISNGCHTCSNGYELLTINGKQQCLMKCDSNHQRLGATCVQLCPTGKILNPDGVCVNCWDSFTGCQTCTRSECTKCGTDFPILKNGACTKPEGDDGVFRSCDNEPNCTTCGSSDLTKIRVCTACKPSYILLQTFKCVKTTCDSGYTRCPGGACVKDGTICKSASYDMRCYESAACTSLYDCDMNACDDGVSCSDSLANCPAVMPK